MAHIATFAAVPGLLIIVWMGVASSSLTKDLQALESLDEEYDAEILKAVFTSMEEYWIRRLSTRHRSKRADAVVCYGEIGCFEDTGPFGYLDMLPSSPEEVSTRFLLYSPHARSDAPLLDVPFANMSGVWQWALRAFNVSAPTKIIVHGFGSSCSHVWVYEMRTALITVEECNVICVDWESGAIIPNYVRAAANTRLVGKQLAMLIQGLQEHVGLRLADVHLIGFSLGAHVAGFAGAEIKNISRITGLDPAGPLFESQDPRARLDSTDAIFVDVIHSNGENLILGGLGSWQPMGHVDFYPNGGRMQKGCTNLFVGAVSDIIWSAGDIEGRSLCNHRRAYKFFTDSVSPRCHFPAFSCDSYDAFLEGKCFNCAGNKQCGNMGYYADKSPARGTLFLVTREEDPFCAHQYLVALESSPSKLPVVSYGKIQVTLMGEKGINETFVVTKKDDEELGVGTTLSKIVVPHPALQNPAHVEIIYTAYSGWITSGLKKWSIDKIKISDSFGKSMSVCKKDLILESGVSVMLKLYPGECNLPKEPVEVTTIDPFFLSDPEPEKKNETKRVSDNVNKTVDGYPAYFTSDNKNSTDREPKPLKISANNTDHLRKNEIVEPVLHPKVKDLKVDESKQSLVRPRGISLIPDLNTTDDTWIPSVELYPPPLGGKQLWETSREPKQYQSISPPKVAKTSGSAVTTLQNKMLNRTRSSNPRQRMYNYSPKNEKSEGVVTVQLLPQHLANLLKQAEEYAKMSLFSPLDIFYRNRNNTSRSEKKKRVSEKRNLQNETKIEEKKDNFIATPRTLDTKTKNFIPRIYEYFEKGLENVRNLFRWEGTEEQRLDGPENVTLVPYYYEGKKSSENAEKYIPLSGSNS